MSYLSKTVLETCAYYLGRQVKRFCRNFILNICLFSWNHVASLELVFWFAVWWRSSFFFFFFFWDSDHLLEAKQCIILKLTIRTLQKLNFTQRGRVSQCTHVCACTRFIALVRKFSERFHKDSTVRFEVAFNVNFKAPGVFPTKYFPQDLLK